jgi:HYDIN/CFA65/VesB family protein/putative pyrroloquinoline-quinone-binding quinoprotein
MVVASLAFAGVAMASGVTNAGDDLRTGWYPDQSAITPQVVSGGSFGKLWSASVNGQVYAQPLLSATGTLIVATENDKVYGLDPASGAQRWMTDLGTPWNPADVSCPDIAPSIGTTSTPVIDPSTNTVYLTHKTYVSGSAAWFMDALDVATGQERSGFPVRLSGTADNNPAASFNPKSQQQRTGLLLMNGVVYMGFGSHCDYSTWQGWVFGVSAAGKITARWVDNAAGSSGAGIWQSGVGLTSDTPGSILLSTGNGGSPTSPAPGSSPPSTFGESIVRLNVQPDGSLKPVDFFTPFDARQLDQYDADFGSGGVVGLPDAYFGTSAFPHLAVAVGKQGYVYLLNRDSLGGYDQGPGGGDDVIQRIGPRTGVWGRAGVWPGDGGYAYIPTAGGPLDVYKYGLSGSGTPSLSLVASSSDVFGWGSGSPVITSNGMTSGTALVWVIWSPNRGGAGGQLRAYDPVPVNGKPVLRYSAPIGTATNYSVPGIGQGRLYVGTRDGTVLAFGSPVSQPLSGFALSFPRTTIGSSSQQTLTLTANQSLTVSSLTSTSTQFALGAPSHALPAALSAGQTISVPVTFSPTQTGVIGGQVNVSTDAGNFSFPLSGTGQSQPPQLAVSPPLLSLGGTAVGSQLSGTVSFSNVGSTTLTISAVHLPSAPFTATNVPVAGDQLAPGATITVDIAFDPTQVGAFTSAIGLDSDGGNKTIGLSATASTPGLLQFSSESYDFGSILIGTTAAYTFTITNAGGTKVTITKSKPPFGGEFAATSSLPEGTTIAPGQKVTETVNFTPTSVGTSTGMWAITGDDGSGPHQVVFTGTGISTPSAGPPQASAVQAGPAGVGPAGVGPAGVGPVAQASGSPVISPPPVEVPLGPKVFPAVATTATIASAYIAYTAAAPSTTRFTLQLATPGRLGAHACVRATMRNRREHRCTRFVTVATFTHLDHVGVNRVFLAYDVHVRKLVPGTYRLQSILIDSAGLRHTFYCLFRVVAGARARR